MTGRAIRGIVATGLACAAGLLAAPVASAQITSVFDGEVPCEEVAPGDIRLCGGTADTSVPTWDGVTPIDVNVALPPEPAGADGPYPMVMIFHGWGGTKLPLATLRPWAEDGYAVFSMSDRGWGNSCSVTDPKRLTPACLNGYNHLMDTRFEVRDAQHLAGVLVDEDVAIPNRIGATGGSYGGGLSMALAALRNRVMMPDDSLVPWVSPDGTAMELAAAQPDIPWTDLAYSLLPNGHTLDYVADAPYLARERIGVLKQSFVAGLYAIGQATSNFSMTDPDANVPAWYARINTGEPYDGDPVATDIADEVIAHHSSYYIDDSIEPAPLLISNGWTDDLFPPDEAIRFYNRTRSEHPGADISLFFSDAGHQRGQNKTADTALRNSRTHAWFDYYLKSQGPAPALGVETLTQTCPDTAASGGPFTAPTWNAIAPGEVRLTDADEFTIAPTVTDPAPGQAYDPVSGGGACATAAGADQTGAASYRLPEAPDGGYTLMGSPTVVADINSTGANNQVAARLVDVDTTTGDATLVARGLYRPEINTGSDPTKQVFQLHPNGWRFEEGHVAKLELLASDAPYGRASNAQTAVAVSNLELRLPVLEPPADLGGGIVSQPPAPKVIPPGYELAADYLASPGGQPISNAQPPTGQAPKAKVKCKKRKKGKAKSAKKKRRCKKKKKAKKR